MVQVNANWDMGTEMATELLETINLMAKSAKVGGTKSMQRIDNQDFKVYWAGTVLRVDIPEASLT
jgi:hypothetical protein